MPSIALGWDGAGFRPPPPPPGGVGGPPTLFLKRVPTFSDDDDGADMMKVAPKNPPAPRNMTNLFGRNSEKKTFFKKSSFSNFDFQKNCFAKTDLSTRTSFPQKIDKLLFLEK